MDLEDTEGEETGEGTGDGLGGVEDCESASEFASTVEPRIWSVIERSPHYGSRALHGLIVDDKGEES
jgi:hypothetical protein